MSFKVGDVVVCIDNIHKESLTIGGRYIITFTGQSNRINLTRNEFSYYGFDSKYFLSIKEYRSLQLKTIMDKL